MNRKSQSQTKFRKVETSRVKNGQSIQTKTLVNNFFSQKKANHAENPENSNKDQFQYKNGKKLFRPEQSQQQVFIDTIHTDGDAPGKKSLTFESPPKKGQNKQQTFQGRKLQYPSTHFQNQSRNQNKNNLRPQSAFSRTGEQTSGHFVDKGKKSRQIQEKQATYDQKVKIAMNYLLENNKDYLAEKLSMCCQKSRPTEETFKMNLAKRPATYFDHYPPKKAEREIPLEPRNKQESINFGSQKVCGNSNTNEVHSGVQGPKADEVKWPEQLKFQGPLNGTTTYSNKFPNYGQFEKMVPVASFNTPPMGLAPQTLTTNKHDFKGQSSSPPKPVSWNNLHPYGNQFNPNRSSEYRTKFNPKEKQVTQKWPMHNPKHLTTNGKFSTEYASNLTNQMVKQIYKDNACNCRERRKEKRIYS